MDVLPGWGGGLLLAEHPGQGRAGHADAANGPADEQAPLAAGRG